jgi:phage terminase large subunit-like protein
VQATLRKMRPARRHNGDVSFDHKLAHGGNPVTRWMAAHVAVAQDLAGNLKPAKDKFTERIDGIVATITATKFGHSSLALQILAAEQPPAPSSVTSLS